MLRVGGTDEIIIAFAVYRVLTKSTISLEHADGKMQQELHFALVYYRPGATITYSVVPRCVKLHNYVTLTESLCSRAL